MFQVKILAHSICVNTQKELTAWELVYPRFIHSELMTHGMLVKNAASSRAIPVQKVIEMVKNNPAMPVHWGKNQPGMQANEELAGQDLEDVRNSWLRAATNAIAEAEYMASKGAHKQVINRILEPFQWMKTVVSGTEWANFYWLRNHEAADPTFYKLASMMQMEHEESLPVALYPGDWHVPYFGKTGHWFKGLANGGYSLSDALNISMSCCAQVSYRSLDDSLEKAERVVERLNLGVNLDEPCHASPSAHQGTPMESMKITGSGDADGWINCPPLVETWQKGITAYHKDLGFMSGNFAGWIQNRQLIEGHCKW